MKSRTLCLIDGSAFVYRAYHAIRGLTNSKGMATNALFGYVNMLLKTRKDFDPCYMVVVLDTIGPSFRKQMYPEYKANRPPLPPDMREQLPYVEPLTDALGIPSMRCDGYEADDVIATLARHGLASGLDTVIVTSDKDLMQLVSPGISMYDPMKEKIIGRDQVIEKFGVPPEQVRDLLAIMGDASDNVPGVHGIGPKGAAKLLVRYGTLDAVLAAAGQVESKREREALLQSREAALLSRDLVTLRFDAPVVTDLELLRPGEKKTDKLRELFALLEFRALLKQLLPGSQDADRRPIGAGQNPAEGCFASGAAGGAAAAPPLPSTQPPPGAGPGSTAPAPAPLHADTASLPPDRPLLSTQPPPGAGPDSPAPAPAPVHADAAPRAKELFPVAPAPAPPVSAGPRMPEPRVVRTQAELESLVTAMAKVGRAAVDTETTAINPAAAALVGISVSLGPESVFYVPVGHKDPGSGGQLPLGLVREKLSRVLGDPGVGKIGQHFKYDTVVLWNHGFAVGGLAFDTMLASYLLDPGRQSHSLDYLSADLLGIRLISYRDVTTRGQTQVRFDEVPVPEAARYSGEDAWATWLLAEILGPQVEATGLRELLVDVELPLSDILARMELTGVSIDRGKLAALSDEFAGRLAALEREIQSLAGVEFNVNSPKQLAEILFDKLQLPSGKKTKTGYSTDVTVLEELAGRHPLPARMLDYRALAKLKSTYVDVLPMLVLPSTGRVHTSFNQAVTATGRLSSSDPNLQNIPVRTEEGKRIREAFVPAAGWKFLSADYSQIELRVLAHVAADPALIQAFRRGDDIHARTAAEIFRVIPGMVTPEMRRAAKTINFGVIYGMSAFRLARDLGIPRAQAQAFIDAYFARYGRIKEFLDRAVREGLEKGYVETLLKRRRFLPELKAGNHQVRAMGERMAINTPVQGGAADIVKLAMIRLAGRLEETGLPARLVLQVHDELVLEVRPEAADAVAALVRETMEGAMALDVPLKVDVGVGANWAEVHA